MKFRNSHKGFTLIEMMVAVSIFIVVLTVSAGALLSIINANRKSQTLRTVMDNLNFAIEEMVRDIRRGTEYSCGLSGPDNCSTGSPSFVFKFVDGTKYVYEKNGDNELVALKLDADNTRLDETVLTTPEIKIDNLTFYVEGVGVNQIQPRVIISLSGHTEYKRKDRSNFSIQTSVTQRVLEK
jgi:prepilin-type N-terminal cleavage/methylation domain-containing protein